MTSIIDTLMVELRIREMTDPRALLQAAYQRDASQAQVRAWEGAADAPTQ